MGKSRTLNALKSLAHRLLVVSGALALTFAFFLVLPSLQAISRPPESDLLVHNVSTANIPPPPPPPEEEQEEEQKQEEEPPELEEDAPPLDLSQLELALDPGLSDGWLGGDFAVKLNTVAAKAEDMDALFSVADLDQKPRVIYQPGPILNAALRKKAPGTVNIIFIVDQDGRVQNAKVQSASDPVFLNPALAAVKKWKFEPGKRNGEAVRFRMRVPIIFPKD